MRYQEDTEKKNYFFHIPESPESTDSEYVIQIQIDTVLVSVLLR